MTTFTAELLEQASPSPSIGLIVLETDETLEGELHRYIPTSDADVFISRVPSAASVTPETLGQMANNIAASAALLPSSIHFDAVGYCCTSGTAVIGAERVATLVQSGCRTTSVSDPVTALVVACRKQHIKRLAFLSPYIESVSDTLRQTLADNGIETPVFGSFHEGEEAKVARIDPACSKRAALDLARAGDVDAIFLSCTNLKTIGILDEIEAEAGLPAFSSNRVLASHLRHLAGVDVIGQMA